MFVCPLSYSLPNQLKTMLTRILIAALMPFLMLCFGCNFSVLFICILGHILFTCNAILETCCVKDLFDNVKIYCMVYTA